MNTFVYAMRTFEITGALFLCPEEVKNLDLWIPPDCADFLGNGLGLVRLQSCTVTETLNGTWELTLVHPIAVFEKWTWLGEGSILRVPVPAAMTPQMNLVTQQYQTQTYDVEIYTVTTQRDPLRLRSGTGTNCRILGQYKRESRSSWPASPRSPGTRLPARTGGSATCPPSTCPKRERSSRARR